MIEVVKYYPDKKEEWNDFITKSKNGTFLFNRNFMDYHSDRFTDFSLMIYKKGKLISCFPANIVNNEIHSHQGLTYGGFIVNDKMRIAIAEEVLEAVIAFYRDKGIKRVFIKQIPSIYHKIPSNEMDYWLWHSGAVIYRRDTTFTVDLTHKLNLSSRKIRYKKKAEKNGLLIKESDDFADFWNKILISNLEMKYNVKPVHSLNEILMLAGMFPKNIRQYNVYFDEKIIAGATLFISGETVHAQYISSNSIGAQKGALDFLFILLMDKFKREGYRYFDFGISNENDGQVLNYSLAEYKEGFGANVFIHEFYKCDL